MDKYTATELAFKNGYEKGYADANAEIVHCKDCKNWRKTGNGCGFCVAWEQGRYHDNYCNYGEERGDG